jgi:hypothetical protein
MGFKESTSSSQNLRKGVSLDFLMAELTSTQEQRLPDKRPTTVSRLNTDRQAEESGEDAAVL